MKPVPVKQASAKESLNNFIEAIIQISAIQADAKTLIPMPEGMDFITAASFVMTFGTSHYALKDRAHLQPGETLLV
jgi:NADPH:quinone reductase-like Zn-dependent oxidoreductase